MTDRTTYAPLILSAYDHEPESYYLMLTDDAMVAVEDEFEACGQYGNGYGWAGVARAAVLAHAPEVSERLTYDPEAGMFIARSRDLDALQRLAALLSQAFHDRARLAELIRGVDPDDFD
ncbi:MULTISPECIES: immunity 51 family protein [unclassified Kitasatospora]|uniref:immunity 51 family protein n=1 Tax=unclassified Kitasatospora TaxID=2633591 RepID=UPI003430A481